jgi:hypothetical protein
MNKEKREREREREKSMKMTPLFYEVLTLKIRTFSEPPTSPYNICHIS